jgi:hypothetical protein
MTKNLNNLTKKELLEIISNMKKKDLVNIIMNQNGGSNEENKEKKVSSRKEIVFNQNKLNKLNNGLSMANDNLYLDN